MRLWPKAAITLGALVLVTAAGTAYAVAGGSSGDGPPPAGDASEAPAARFAITLRDCADGSDCADTTELTCEEADACAAPGCSGAVCFDPPRPACDAADDCALPCGAPDVACATVVPSIACPEHRPVEACYPDARPAGPYVCDAAPNGGASVCEPPPCLTPPSRPTAVGDDGGASSPGFPGCGPTVCSTTDGCPVPPAVCVPEWCAPVPPPCGEPIAPPAMPTPADGREPALIPCVPPCGPLPLTSGGPSDVPATCPQPCAVDGAARCACALDDATSGDGAAHPCKPLPPCVMTSPGDGCTPEECGLREVVPAPCPAPPEPAPGADAGSGVAGGSGIAPSATVVAVPEVR